MLGDLEKIKKPIKFLSEIKNINGHPYALAEGEDLKTLCVDMDSSGEWVISVSWDISHKTMLDAPRMSDEDLKNYVQNIINARNELNKLNKNLTVEQRRKNKKRYQDNLFNEKDFKL